MARPAPDGRGGELRRRIVSAAVLLPAALVAVHLGGWVLAVVVIAAAGMLGWEWSRLCGFAAPRPLGIALIGALALGVTVAHAVSGHAGMAAGFALLGVLAAFAGPLASHDGGAWRWFGLGLVALGVPCISFLWLRTVDANLVFWLLGVTWAADIGAFFVGRAVGGPRLAPAISPNKTWSGFAGGLAAAAAVGGLFGAAVGTRGAVVAASAAVLVALAAVVGDLGESALKRRFGAKDAGKLIPGHGGVLDRVDSLLVAAPAAALLVALGWRWL
ncbi:MAG: phosphatidate cytidylyltransferase [Alphaproteobacteria bacterium]